LVLVAITGILFAAAWEYKEASTQFSYSWEISETDLSQFIKTGQMPESGISGSFYYKGRYYPLHTHILSNTPDELTFHIKEKEEVLISAPGFATDREHLDPVAIDDVDIRDLKDFVRLQFIPGIGTLLEIMPVLPTEDGHIRCLKKAEINLLPTSDKRLQTSNLKKEKTGLAKTTSLKTQLPNEFMALYIQEPGVYQITGRDLADRGVDLRTVKPRQLKLFWWGEEIPCRVTTTYELGIETFQYHDILQFYIPELKNPYGDYVYNPFTDYDVIHLNWSEGNGMRFIQENSEITGTAIFLPQDNQKFRSTVHIEKNQRYEPLARLHEDELSHKYEHRFFSPPISVGRSVSFPFELWDPVLDSPYNVEFTLRMQGLTYSVDDEMDHQIYVTVNDRYLLEDEWDGQLPRVSSNINMFYGHQYLAHGENKIGISVKGFENNPYLDDKVLFDWLKVSYDRYMIAHNNVLQFSPQHGPGRYLFRVQGLSSASDIMIIKNSINWIRGYHVIPEDTVRGVVTYSIYFEDECVGDETYIVAGPGKKDDSAYGIVTIDSLRYVNRLTNEYYNTNMHGDYIIVTHKDFYEKANDLIEHKRTMGFTPVIYELERIYDEYNHSNESPYAIKAFLTDAYNNWHILPRYVLFIGDTGTKNALPTIKYQSTGAIGAILAESWFVDIDDDFVMDMALGRLPVTTEEELDSVITKIINFDLFGGVPSQKMNRVGLLAGPQAVFKTQMQNYLNIVSPDHIQTDRLYLYDANRTGDFDAGVHATDTLVKMINDGIFCLNYIGHGGGYTWDNYVLPYSAFNRFMTNNAFIVNSMTCFTNTFSNDNALGEMFIRHPRGAVSILSTTGYGWINSNYYIFEKIMQRMFRDNMSHGQAFRFAMTDYFFSTFGRNANFIDQVDGQTVYKYFRKSMFYQMCILGDPSARFPQTQKSETIDISPKSVTSGQLVTIEPLQSNIKKGVADIVGARGQSRKFPVKQKIALDFINNRASFTMPEYDESMSDGKIQLIYWDDAGNVFTGAEHIAFDAPYIASFTYYPRQPEISDSGVVIRMQVNSSRTIEQAYLRVYSSMALNSSYRKLALQAVNDNTYETILKLYYTSHNTFYTAGNDTSEALAYYSGIYFMPVFHIGGDSLTGDYYKLNPHAPSTRDIAVLDYGVERGKSKLVLFNQADTSVHVALSMTLQNTDLDYAYYDTLLTMHDVDAKYESGTDKINTFYLDFLPAYGNATVNIHIDPIEIVDSDTSNNTLQKLLDNKWLLSENGELVNVPGDTVALPGTNFIHLTPGVKDRSRQAIYINTYNRSYTLSQFGATQALQEVLYINSEKNNIDFMASVAQSALGNDKLICYLSSDLKRFYTLPITMTDTLVYFPIRENGYYLFAYSNETTPPDIEVNLNARQILVRGYVSERSDFSAIIRDNYGVNPLEEFWEILLDGEPIPDENISRVPNENIREMGINFKLSMDAGEHTLQLIAHDLVGNRAETEEFQIVYTGESQLINYGNFPNPFTTRTTFIYELTEQFDDLVIKIFTVSGQKIYTMSLTENAITDLPLQSIGYHEIPWYGRDEFGNTVANGVYFYVIEGTVDGRKVKSKGKIAKLR
jgi:hypothetical protein